jgi:hypothetical protein
LNREQIRAVARISVDRIVRRPGLEGRGIRSSVSERALDALASEGFSADYGARGLRRFLESALVAPVSTLLSRLGKGADGALLIARHASETEEGEVPEGFSATADAEEKAGSIVVRAHARRAAAHAQNVSGLRAVSAWRRRARALLALTPLQEARERIKELTVELSQPKRSDGRAFDATGELSREHARLSEIVAPVETAVRELEDIESLLIAALDEPAAPELDLEAKGAFDRFQKALVAALAEVSRRNEITFAVHELDAKKVLHEFLIPLLRATHAPPWVVTLHLDRGERDGVDWPPVGERRWGPPLDAAKYLARWGEAGTDHPFENVLVRVRGVGAGALLAFALGRFRYHGEKEYGEIWVRWVRSRYELTDDDWKHASLAPAIDLGVGRRQGLRLEIWPGTRTFDRQPGRQYWEDLEPWQIFERWHELVFEQMVTLVRAGQAYLPADP